MSELHASLHHSLRMALTSLRQTVAALSPIIRTQRSRTVSLEYENLLQGQKIRELREIIQKFEEGKRENR